MFVLIYIYFVLKDKDNMKLRELGEQGGVGRERTGMEMV